MAQVGDSLTAEQLKECEQLGILVDKDDQGVLLQIFTKPLGACHMFGVVRSAARAAERTAHHARAPHLSADAHTPPRLPLHLTRAHAGDRPTVFIEIIQRVGCVRDASAPSAAPAPTPEAAPEQQQATAAAAAVVPPGPPNEQQGAGCGGFGKGNFGELFKRIEDYERTLTIG